MNMNMVRQPIMDTDNKLLGYELLIQEKDGAGLYNDNDVAAHAIENLLLEFNRSAGSDAERIFVTFPPDLLMKRIPDIFSPNRLVIQIEDAVTVDPHAQKVLYEYHQKGYEVAMKEFEFSARYFALLDAVDYIKLDIQKVSDRDANIIKVGASMDKKMLAYNVDSAQALEKAKSLNVYYVQGSAVAQLLHTPMHSINHLQSNFFQLMVAVTKDEPDVDEIAEIISRDVTLTFSLLKLVNSAYFALRNRVFSVKQALVVLGLGQLKQWIYLLSFRKNDSHVAEELIKTSFLRASFCSALSEYATGLALAKSDAYLLGMFSTLGLLLDVSMEEALAELPVLAEIKQALVSNDGPCMPLYSLVLRYEAADWASVSQYATELGIPQNIVSQKYFECMESVNKVWRSLMQPME